MKQMALEIEKFVLKQLKRNDEMLYYIHGYLSSPNSTKGTILKQKLEVKSIKYRDCEPEDLIISDCLKRIQDEIKDDVDPVLIGSSLGGFLSAKMALNNPEIKRIILFNPAIIPKDYDIRKIEGMPLRILEEMMEPRFFSEKIKARINIFCGTLDDTVPNKWVIDFAKAQEANIKFLHDDHSLSGNTQKLPKYIEKILIKKD